MKGLLGAVGVGLLAVALAGGAYVFSGRYNVAATEPHSSPAAWILEETMERSVRRHAQTIEVPPLQHPAQARTGYQHYAAMCEVCHGAPGVEPSEIARGLEPAPPPLHEPDEAGEWSAAELFWITKNGIKMTGMPAWGPTHSDEEIWAIVAFLETLPQLSREEYAALGSDSAGRSAHPHVHGSTAPPAHVHEHGSAEPPDEHGAGQPHY